MNCKKPKFQVMVFLCLLLSGFITTPSYAFFPPKTPNFTEVNSLPDTSLFTFTLSSQPGIRNASFLETFNTYTNINGTIENWHELKVNPETANSWRQNPSFIQFLYHQNFQPWSFHLNIGLQRDIEAWYWDPLGSNLPQEVDELNINTQPEFWVQYNSDHFHLQMGQFQPKIGPSQDRGVVVSGPLLHRGLQTQIQHQGFSFTWFWSSLDPHLSEPEQDLQATSPVSNARFQNYNELSKNLFLHRFDYQWSKLRIGMTETLLLGGKYPDFWETQPFTVYHNNYPDGYGNTMLAFDIDFTPNKQHRIFAEVSFDDLTGGGAEDENNSSNIMAYILGYHFDQEFGENTLSSRVEFIHVNPIYGNRDLPLLQYTQREVLRSNYRPPPWMLSRARCQRPMVRPRMASTQLECQLPTRLSTKRFI
jgi:hypothetical protein